MSKILIKRTEKSTRKCKKNCVKNALKEQMYDEKCSKRYKSKLKNAVGLRTFFSRFARDIIQKKCFVPFLKSFVLNSKKSFVPKISPNCKKKMLFTRLVHGFPKYDGCTENIARV